MKRKLFILLTLTVLLSYVGSLQAHHASRQIYESKTITIRGVVTEYEWSNPHSIVSVAVKDDSGTVQQWHAEVLPPSEMLRAGWTKESLKPGDEVTLTGRPGKNAQRIMWLETLVTADGRKLSRTNP